MRRRIALSLQDLDSTFAHEPLHQVSPKGRGPGRRSEHSAAAVDSTMFVIGGRSTTTEFKDMFALDTEVDPPVWTEVSVFDQFKSSLFRTHCMVHAHAVRVSKDLEALLHSTSLRLLG